MRRRPGVSGHPGGADSPACPFQRSTGCLSVYPRMPTLALLGHGSWGWGMSGRFPCRTNFGTTPSGDATKARGVLRSNRGALPHAPDAGQCAWPHLATSPRAWGAGRRRLGLIHPCFRVRGDPSHRSCWGSPSGPFRRLPPRRSRPTFAVGRDLTARCGGVTSRGSNPPLTRDVPRSPPRPPSRGGAGRSHVTTALPRAWTAA